MVRITKPTGSIFVHNIPKWLTYYASSLNEFAVFRHWIAWDELASPMGKSLQLAHYGILFYTKNRQQHTVYEIRYPHQRCRKCGYLHKDYAEKRSDFTRSGPLFLMYGQIFTACVIENSETHTRANSLSTY